MNQRVKFTPVPYKGTPQAITDLLGGTILMAIVAVGNTPARSIRAQRTPTGLPAMTETTAFDPRQHRMCETRYFDDFVVGEKFVLPSRTMTDGIFAAFQAASGDNHPVHYNVEYCRERGMPNMLAHGFQVVAQTCGGAGLFAHMVEDSLRGFIDQSSRFLGMVFVGDTLYVTLEVAELTPNRTTGVLALKSTVYNQHGKLVMDGMQRYLLRKRPTGATVSPASAAVTDNSPATTA